MGEVSYKEEVRKLIGPLLKDYDVPFIGASPEELAHFEEKAEEHGIPRKLIAELVSFYEVLNGIDPSLDSLSIHRSEDAMIYEFWESHQRLWIGQRDMDMISWQDDMFHLGGAGNLNYGDKYIFTSFLDLLKMAFAEWYPDTN